MEGAMFEWLRNITLGQAWVWCKTAMVVITPATIVWATLWPIAWSYYIAPAIAAEAETALADNLADIQAQIDKIVASQSQVGEASRDEQASNKELTELIVQMHDMLRQKYCLDAGRPLDCQP
jgi:hypothetical protein